MFNYQFLFTRITTNIFFSLFTKPFRKFDLILDDCSIECLSKTFITYVEIFRKKYGIISAANAIKPHVSQFSLKPGLQHKMKISRELSCSDNAKHMQL